MLELNVDKEHASESKRNSDFVTMLHNFPQIALGTPRQKGMVVLPLFISTVFNTLLTPHAGNPWLPKAGKHLKQLALHWLVRALSGDIQVEQVQRGSIEQDRHNQDAAPSSTAHACKCRHKSSASRTTKPLHEEPSCASNVSTL